ncbi:MAG: ABC transporter substrate-binding protein [Methanotrichaceae archaeon]|nr:ABC transporter substrate-binding protein [Methanotrichaceae archaeon]
MLKRYLTNAFCAVALLLMMSISGAVAEDVRLVMPFMPGENLDPAFDYSGWYLRQAGIYETLFAYDENMNLVPELARGYERASDTEWIIHLREGVQFHDGTPFDADAAIYSINRVREDPENRWYDQYSFIDSITAADDHTIKITTKEPYAPTLAAFADIRIACMVSPAADNLKTEPVGTGPFQFVSYDPDVKLTMKGNENYWNGPVEADGAVVSYIAQPETRALMLEGDEVDIAWAMPAQWYETIEDGPTTSVASKDTMRTYFMFVNTAKPPLDKVEVRQAINYAINREELVDTALEGVAGTPAKCFWPSNYPWSANDELMGYPYDPDKAKELLEDAGLTWNGEAWLYDGKPFELSIKTYTSRPANKPSAEVIASQLENIGIKTSVETLETAAIKSDMSNGNYDLALYAYGVATNGDPDYFVSQQFLSNSTEAGWTRYPGLDDLIAKGRTTLDQDERMEIYKEIQEHVLEDSPEIYLFYDKMLAGVNDRVKGFEIYPSEITILTKNVALD